MSEKKPVCPQCGSSEAWKFGSRDFSTMNYACKRCGAYYSEPWRPPQEGLRCPTCGSQRLQRNGHQYINSKEKIQRWLCNECGHIFCHGISKGERRTKSNIAVTPPADLALLCPRCSCQKVWKDGSYYPPFEEEIKVQRYLCPKCGRRFSRREPNIP